MTATHRLALPALLLLAAGAAPCLAQGISWRTDYNKAVNEAAQTGRPVFIDVDSDNCHWCRQLDQRTFTDGAVVKLLNERFIPLKVNGPKNAYLVQALRIQSYPTLVFAGPDGTIVGYKEGFQEAAALRAQMVKVLASVGTPDWMARDLDAATKAVAAEDPARAVTLLRGVLEDGKDRPAQKRARKLLADLEAKAAAEARLASELATRGKTEEAVAAYNRLSKEYPGTLAERQGKQALMKLASRAEASDSDRRRQAGDLLDQAWQDYRNQRFSLCLDRCEILADGYADLPHAKEAAKLAEQIKDNAEWARRASDQLGERLSVLYLALADSWLKKGQPQQAIFYLDRVVKTFPGTRQAEEAQAKLARLRGAPEPKR